MYLHEGSFLNGMKHADSQIISIVVDGDHIKSHSLRDGQDHRDHPN